MERATHARKSSRLVILGSLVMVLPLAGRRAVQRSGLVICILIAIVFPPAHLSFISTTAKAQNSNQQCTQLLRIMAKSFADNNPKLMISSHREYLSYCRDYMQAAEYPQMLGGLATGLNEDNQHQEALAVSNRCLQFEPTNMPCIYEKANSLFSLRRVQETKSFIEKSLTMASITELDDAAKKALRRLLTDVNIALKNQPAAHPMTRTPSLEGDKYGTGFYVDVDGHVITNRHVVEGCKTIETADHIVLSIIQYNKAIDVALLQANSFKQPSYAKLRQNNAVIGESVIVFGFPLPGILSKSGNLTTGVVSATSGVGNNQRNIKISAPVQPGNSGGPLLDQSGNVIGVVVSKLNAVTVAGITGDLAQNVNFAIKGSEVIAFLGRNNVVPQFATSTENIKTEAVATLASSFTVQLICHH